MSEENNNNVSSSTKDKNDRNSPWLSWIQKAKDATQTTLNSVKKDLEEFGTVVQTQTLNTWSTIKDQVPKVDGTWVTNLMDSVNNVLNLDDDLEPVVNRRKKTPRSKASLKLYAIQADPNTYCQEPSGAPDLFEDWVDHFNINSKEREITDLLKYSSIIRQIYTENVPHHVSHCLFWYRYFYRCHQLDFNEKRLKRTKVVKSNRKLQNGISLPDISLQHERSPRGYLYRKHKSPSLDMELREAELIAKGLVDTSFKCASSVDLTSNNLFSNSPEAFRKQTDMDLQSDAESVEWAD